MKKFFSIFLSFCFAFLFFIPVFADSPLVTYNVSEPIIGDGFYAGYIVMPNVDRIRLFQVISPLYNTQVGNYDSSANYNIKLYNTVDYELSYTLSMETYNDVYGLMISVYITSLISAPIIVNRISLDAINNSIVSMSYVNVPVFNGTPTRTFVGRYFINLDDIDLGVFFKGVYFDEINSSHNLVNLPFCNVIWGSDSLIYNCLNDISIGLIPFLDEAQNLLVNILGETQDIHSVLYDFLSAYNTAVEQYLKKIYSEVSFANLWEMHNYLKIIMEYLRDWLWEEYPDYANQIITKLDSILSALNGGADTETFPSDPAVSDGISGYVDSESGYMNNFENNLGQIEDQFSAVDNGFNSVSSAFAFVKNIFESFVSGFTPSYLVILFSLSFGVVVLIIGRKVG